MSETPETLDALIRVPAPSGYETPAAEVWREAASFGEVAADVLGSSTVAVGVADDRPTVAIVGHIDEIGLYVSHVDDEGFVWFGPIGGWDPQNLVGQRVIVRGRDGEVSGVIGKKPIHLLEPDDRKKPAEIKAMHIDIGAKDKDDALQLVSVGDPAVLAAEPLNLPNGRLVSRSLDNRLGSYVALEVARRISAGEDVPVGVVGCAVSQEEIGLFGSATTGFSLNPDIGIAVDVTHATDAPGISKQAGERRPRARLRARHRPRFDAEPEGLRAAPRDRGGRGDGLHARGLGPLHRHRRRLAAGRARRHRRRARIDTAPLHALDRRDDLARRRRGHDPPARGVHPPPRPRGVVPALAGGDASRKLSEPRPRRARAGGTPRPAR